MRPKPAFGGAVAPGYCAAASSADAVALNQSSSPGAAPWLPPSIKPRSARAIRRVANAVEKLVPAIATVALLFDPTAKRSNRAAPFSRGSKALGATRPHAAANGAAALENIDGLPSVAR